MADAAHDAASAEVSRLLLRTSSLESQLSDAQLKLEEERKQSEIILESRQKHADVMERMEQLNVVTESNRLLRHERETLRLKLTEVENQVGQTLTPYF